MGVVGPLSVSKPVLISLCRRPGNVSLNQSSVLKVVVGIPGAGKSSFIAALLAPSGASRLWAARRARGRSTAGVTAATAAHLRAVNARERREETLEAPKKPAKGGKVVDDWEQNRAFAERSSWGNSRRLLDQYRMHPAICAAVSRAFYGGALWTPQAVAAAQLEAPLHFVDFGRGHAGSPNFEF